MKVRDLLERKSELRQKITDLGKELSELGKEIEEKDLTTFIANGELPSPDGHRIQRLRNQHRYLLKLGQSLDIEIARANDKEGQKEIAKLERKADGFTVIRQKLSNKIQYYQSKITQLREDQKITRTEEERLRRACSPDGSTKERSIP